MATYPPSVPAIFCQGFSHSKKMSSTQVGLRFAESNIYHPIKFLSTLEINLKTLNLKY